MSLTRRDLVTAATTRGRAVGDREVVLSLLALEQRSVRVYELLTGSGELRGRAAAAADLFLGQERRHEDALAQALRGIGASPPRRRPESPDPPGDARGLIRFALEHERECIRAYYEAQAKLRAPALLGTAASVMANEAQHLAVLRQLLGREPSPVAFVTGSS